jgi:hypothetical protein
MTTHPLVLAPNCSKKEKKNFLSLPLPPFHDNALRLPLRPSRPERGCHFALLLPCAPSDLLARPRRVRFSPPPVARWCRWCSLLPSHVPPARPSQAGASGGGARAPSLPAGSAPGGWNRPALTFPSPMLHTYVSIVSDVSYVRCNCYILML